MKKCSRENVELRLADVFEPTFVYISPLRGATDNPKVILGIGIFLVDLETTCIFMHRGQV